MAGNKIYCILVLTIAMATLTGCRRDPTTPPATAIAVTNSYLASAVKEIAGGTTPVFTLAPPGTCPGHFDIRPSQVNQLRSCRLFLRFDFQQALDRQLQDLAHEGLTIHTIDTHGALNEPATYLAACRQIADLLVASHRIDPATATDRLTKLEHVIDVFSRESQVKIDQSHLRGQPVLCSHHQEGFCTWLGLTPAATFTGSDAVSLGQMDRAIQVSRQAGVTLIIANRPEGRAAADALAERLGARVVVFDNFPDEPVKTGTFKAMVSRNIDRLLQTVQP